MGLSQMRSTLLSKLLLFSIVPILGICDDIFIPLKMPAFSPEKASLGMKLYRDAKFSEQKRSCDSCHNLYLNSSGASVRNGEIPTILNAYYIERYSGGNFFPSLNERIKTSVLSPKELASSKEKIELIITQNIAYKREFKKLYGKANFENFVDALGEYLKSKTTINSKFDRVLRDEEKFSESEFKGYLLFIELCSYCHNGANLGTNSYAKVPNKNLNFNPNTRIANYRSHTYKRVPTLRNITKTAPYINGEYSLARSIKFLFRDVFDYSLDDDDLQNLLDFLATL
ncbi:cytochrome-c peroxidase [Campylobacter sp. JMF_08 NE1]|uniref:cytochrome-c peroxidase n=1 Tax=Campylobacter sp. JMF_08 NE1 TaxID=2983821 RepID=UPI0022EA0D73|nr:cytochrome c peroxidase [Campylobacter sp. JMF_08 NE1]